MTDEVFTELQPPPEYRGGSGEAYSREIARWALKYHLTLEPLLKDALQRLAEIAALTALTQTIDNPPTQAQVEAVQAKVNSIITAAASV